MTQVAIPIAGAIVAAIYAWHCPDDSPLVLAIWYTVAIADAGFAGDPVAQAGCASSECRACQ
ncbi:NrsF family protein [Rhizobium sp. TRM96647]|uniref:NrsF family protein n=1 Tax=Rhizobium sp. TRM96647 TaxID=2979861 RepID=UPI0039911A81